MAANLYVDVGIQQSQQDSLINIAITTNVCHLCGGKVTGAALSWDGIKVAGALVEHLK